MHIHCKLSKCIGQIQCSYEHYLVSPPGNDSFWEDLSFTTDVFFQAEDGIRDFCLSRGLGDVYKRQLFRLVEKHQKV